MIELLVTLGVIALLVGILVPVLLASREKARAASCLNNYHQLGLAIHMYAQDNDDASPPDGGSFAGLIQDCSPYGVATTSFACPDDYDRAKEGRPGTYRMASLYQGKPLACGWPDPYNSNQPARPASTILLYEAEQDFSQSPIVPTYRHGRGTQVLYFDAHVHWIPQGKNTADTDD